MPAREIEPAHDERLEHIGRSEEFCERTAGERRDFARELSGEVVSGEEPSRAPLRSEEAASEQQPLSEEVPREVASSSKASGEEPSVAMKVPMHAVTEPAEPPPELRAEATDLAVGRRADDENAGTAAQSHDTAAQSADDAVETALSDADDIESLLETEPAEFAADGRAADKSARRSRRFVRAAAAGTRSASGGSERCDARIRAADVLCPNCRRLRYPRR